MNHAVTYRAFLLELPLRSPIPVGGQRWDSRPVVLVRGEDKDGHVSWGEAAPLDGYGPDCLEDVVEKLTGPVMAFESLDAVPSLACAVGTVRMGLVAAQETVQLGDILGTVSCEELRPASLKSSPTPDQGASVVKIKIGGASGAEVHDVSSILSSDERLRVRLDGNGLPSKQDALQFLESLGEYRSRVEYFEEPFAGCFDSDHRPEFPVPLAIDESLSENNWRHADACVIKPSLMGDPQETMALASEMQGEGRRVVVSSAFESAVGMTLVTWMAACLTNAAPGLGTYQYIADDLGGRSGHWDTPLIRTSELPSYPTVDEAALSAALSQAPGDTAMTLGGSLLIKELTTGEGT